MSQLDRLGRPRQDTDRLPRSATLHGGTFRHRALAAALGICEAASAIVERVSREVRLLAERESHAILEQARMELEVLDDERRRAVEQIEDARQLATTIVSEARREADELIRYADLWAEQFLVAARREVARIREETERGVAQIHTETAAETDQLHGPARRELEAVLAAVRHALAAPIPEPTQTAERGAATTGKDLPTPRSHRPPSRKDRPSRIGVATVCLLVLIAVGSVILAVAESPSDTNRAIAPAASPRPSIGERVVPTSTSRLPDVAPSAASSSAPSNAPSSADVSVGGIDATRAPSTFDQDAFYQIWTTQGSALAPAGLTVLQQQSLDRPVIEGAVSNADGLADALAKGWVKGYGVFFGSAGSEEAGPSVSATATVYRYSSSSAAETAFEAAQRAYLSATADGVTEVDDVAPTPGAASFAARYVDDSDQIVTTYIIYSGTIVQVSVTVAAGASDGSIQTMVAAIAQWAATSGA